MLAAARAYGQLATAATSFLEYVSAFNRRTLDFYAARAYSWLALVAERRNEDEAFRPTLLAAHRTACLRHDEYGQAVLLNLVLRSYIRHNAYDAAAKLVANAVFPEAASNSQYVRYLYYTGRIRAVRLDYSDSYAALLQAERKAPLSALAFRVLVRKVATIVQLLTGEIPERASFRAPGLAAPLAPYLELTRAVRAGDLPAFTATLRTHAAVFARDHTDTLVARLEANVIKTGLRKLALSYSRISFADIAAKLQLGSAEDAEFLCAKARCFRCWLGVVCCLSALVAAC